MSGDLKHEDAAAASAPPAESVERFAPGDAVTPAPEGAANPYRPEGAASPQVPVYPSIFERVRAWATDYFLLRDPTFWSALLPFLFVALILFTRWPGTNYIFDEQEALLANPYVNGASGLKFLDAIHRDFWGLPPDRSIGSYRPIPNFLWRALWGISKAPFFHHIYNVLFHAVNGAILTCVAFAWTRRRGIAWLSGLAFVACAVLTEAVSGIVGIADVLGGMGALLALASLSLPAWAMPWAVFSSVAFGLFCKESALVCVPLIPFAALVAAPLTHPERPARVLRALLALVASAAAFYLYVELRRRWFPSPLPEELKTPPPEGAPFFKQVAYDFLVWFRQAPLPKDPLNNPLATADVPHRIAGALRVYWRGLVQIVFPKALSGDYSYPQEPVPEQLIFPESVLGAAMTALPPLAAVGLWIGAMVGERRARRARARAQAPYREAAEIEQAASEEGPSEHTRRMLYVGGAIALLIASAAIAIDLLVRTGDLSAPRFQVVSRLPVPLALPGAMVMMIAIGMLIEGMRRLPRPDRPGEAVPLSRAAPVLLAVGFVWVVVSYFPHSNIPTVLPTVRAERFWYFPAMGSSLAIAAVFAALHDRAKRGVPWLVPAFATLFFLFQGVMAYRHATDYRNDLAFWEATREAVPRSAKAHLNYSVMKGARGDMPTRLEESKIALSLAPKWPMAHVYTGDTLCRMHRAEEAWPFYKEGFILGPNELSLIALALQCMHDEGALMSHEDELRTIADEHEGTWIAYLAIDTINNHEKNKGVDPKYRPRGYNEGPKE